MRALVTRVVPTSRSTMRGNLLGLKMLSGWSVPSKVIGDSDQCRYSRTIVLMALITQPISLSLCHDSWGWPIVNRHDRLLLGERGGSLPHRVTFGPLAFGKSSRCHIVLHHGAFLQLVSNRVRMIWACCFEKLFDVIGRLLHLALRITLSGGNEVLIRVTSVLIIVALIVAGGDCNSLLLPLRARLVTSSNPPCTLVGCLGWHPLTTAGGPPWCCSAQK
jgi:hypothetical protein